MMPPITRTAAAAAILAAGYLALGASASAVCTDQEWFCDKKCHPLKIRCNGSPQCGDRSDEMNCKNCNKTAKLFQCDDGECLADKYKCDGRHHCFDGTDERNCSAKDLKSPCRNGMLNPCGTSWQCYNLQDECDGVVHCDNGFDEQCNGKCTALGTYQSYCGNRWCRLPRKKFICRNGDCGRDECNGIPDCLDGSDEMNCPNGCSGIRSTRHCGDGKQCILSDNWCNGVVDCKDGSDENACNCTYKHICDNGAICMWTRRVCDGEPDCKDHSDEMNCGQKCPGSYARCDNNECTLKTNRCDGKADCKDHSDEMGCGESCSFKKGLFFCKNGECTSGRCNGKMDCRDGTDEENCPDNC